MEPARRFDHPAWVAAAGTLVSYGLLLLGMFLALFVLPFLAYSTLF